MNVIIKFRESVANKSIEVMEMKTRTYHVLQRAGCQTIKDVIEKFDELPKVRGCGVNVMNELKNELLVLWLDDKLTQQGK